MKKLVVLCPSDNVTGGPEALHQLVATARSLGVDASLLYYPTPRLTVNPAYAHYDVDVIGRIADQVGVVVVANETALDYVPTSPTLAQWALWWLSVDNLFTMLRMQVTTPKNDPDQVRWLCSPTSRLVHLTQSQYAREFLHARGTRSLMLTDYLSDAFVRDAEQRREQPKKDVVLYNPRKGMQITQRLIDGARGELEFVPITGLDAAGVAELLGSARLYVDFGEHPGRDRLPREAALSGCCVITGRRGAAANRVDIPLPDRFKLDEHSPTFVSDFLELASATLRDFDRVTAELDDYRAVIAGQHDAFVGETSAFLDRVKRVRLGGYQASAKGTKQRRR